MDLLLTLGELTGLGGFFYYLVRGLRQEISSLKNVIDTQHKTLDVMERRVQETEKVGKIYRDLFASLPSDIENFRAIVSKTKDETIVELQSQNEIMKYKLRAAEMLIEKSGRTR